MKEVDIQTKIKKSIILDGGYCFKMSNQFLSGVVDLFVVLPPFVPCIVEVKDLKECVDDFNRKIGITPLQGVMLDLSSDVYETAMVRAGIAPSITWGAVSGILVALRHRGEHRLVGLPKVARRLTSSYTHDPSCWRKRRDGSRVAGGYYEIAPLLQAMGVSRIW